MRFVKALPVLSLFVLLMTASLGACKKDSPAPAADAAEKKAPATPEEKDVPSEPPPIPTVPSQEEAMPPGVAAADLSSLIPRNRAARRKSASALPNGRYFTEIPKDAPYVFATFTPVPGELFKEAMAQMAAMGPLLKIGKREIKGKSAEDKLTRALIDEMVAILKPGGLKKAGFTMSPHYAFYGVGPFPVFRFELASGKRLRKVFKRVLRKGKIKLRSQRRKRKEYWVFDDELFVAILDTELVMAFAPKAAIKTLVPYLLGERKVPNAMADGAALRAVAERYGFDGAGVGYVDFNRLYNGFVDKESGLTRELWNDLVAGAGRKMAAPCRREIESTVARVPRVAFGYDEFNKARMMFSMIEMDAAHAESLIPLVTKVPGLVPSLVASSKFVAGGAMRVPQARALAARLAGALETFGTACQDDGLTAIGQDLREKAAKQLPQPWDRTRGGYVALQSLELGGGMPGAIEAFAVLHTWAPKKVLAQLKPLVEGQLSLDVPANGAFHKLSAPMADPFTKGVFMAVAKHSIAVALGESGRSNAKRAMALPATASPFFLFGYDAAFFLKLMQVGASAGGEMEKAVFDAMAALYKGPVGAWAYASPEGLAMTFEVYLEAP